MEIILQIYFGINLFVSGFWFNENSNYRDRKYTSKFLLFSLAFGTLILIITPLHYFLSPKIEWLYREILFNYRFHFTKYWDNVLLNEDYNSIYKTREEKLKVIMKNIEKSSKQTQRHFKLVEKKYGR